MVDGVSKKKTPMSELFTITGIPNFKLFYCFIHAMLTRVFFLISWPSFIVSLSFGNGNNNSKIVYVRAT